MSESSQGTSHAEGAAPAPTTAPSAPAVWGQEQVTWVKMRDLASDLGTTEAPKAPVFFEIVRVSEAVIKEKPSYVFHLDYGRAFSASKERSSVASMIARNGIPPPTNSTKPRTLYWVEKTKTQNRANTSGYDLLLRAHAEGTPFVPPAPPAEKA